MAAIERVGQAVPTVGAPMNPHQPDPSRPPVLPDPVRESATFQLPAGHDTEPLPNVPVVAPRPANRLPMLLVAGVVILLIGWASAASFGLAFERNAHHQDAAKIAEQATTIAAQEKELARLRTENATLQTKLRAAEKNAPSPQARQAIKDCAASAKRVGKVLNTFPLNQLPVSARNGVVFVNDPACAKVVSLLK